MAWRVVLVTGFVTLALLVLAPAAALAQAPGKPGKPVTQAPGKAKGRTGKLEVAVAVAGAEIFIDGAPVALSPMAGPLTLAVGTHSLKVAKAGYAEFLDTVKIGTNETTTVEVDLLPFKAVVNVSSDPPGADILVDEQLVGQTPMRVELEAGKHGFRLSIDGYHDAEELLQLQAGETYQLDLKLIALPPPPRPVGKKDRPIYKKWWFWAATGVVVVGATALVIGASGDGDPLAGADRVIDVTF